MGDFVHSLLNPKIVGVVVLYHPDTSVIDNIRSYLNDLQVLYVVDNSEKPHILASVLEKEPKIVYFSNNKNLGIAKALNQAANYAMESQCDWLLTMDQDSKASPMMFSKMMDCIRNRATENIGIFTPYHANRYFPESQTTSECSEILVTMTSGNLLNLNAFKTVGPFLESLFIDHVDTEYCLRLHDYGYKIVQINRAILYHNVGDLKLHRIGQKTFFSTNHAPLRKYYVYRNGSAVLDLYSSKFPEYCKKLRSRYWIDAFIVLFYEKAKWAKFKMMLRGYLDYKRDKFGKHHD